MSIDRDITEAARKAVQSKINWLREERDRLEALIRPEREALERREQEKREVEEELRKLEAFMRGTKEIPQVCASCKKRDRCAGPGPGRTGCGYWSPREELEQGREEAQE